MQDVIRHVVVRGRVQGVGYRAWVEDVADGLGLAGWVRNRRDGSVEALFAGPDELVAEMIARCRRGPPLARVDAIAQDNGRDDDLNLRAPGERFCVLPTL